VAKKTAIANPIVLLGLDASQLTSGIGKTISAARLSGAQIGKAMSAGAAGAFRSPLMAVAGLNQAMEFSAKISKTIGAPIRALMDREQMAAKVTGIGTIDTATSNTFTAGIARFADQFNVMLADVAIALDNTFDLKGKLEYARGAISGISALLTAFFGNLEPIVKDPEALTKQFKAGALMVVNVFEFVAIESKKVYDNVVSALDSFGINIKLLNDVFSGVIVALKALNPNTKKDPRELQGTLQDAFAAGSAFFLGLGKAAVGINTKDAFAILDNVIADRRANIALFNKGNGGGLAMPQAGAPMALGQGPNIAGLFQKAKDAINAAGFIPPAVGAELIFRQADVIMGKIGGSLSNLGGMIASQIAPAMQAGTANLDEALVKATLQGQGGDIQQRIEAAIREQITIQTQQATLLERIRATIAAKPGLAVLGGV